MKGNCSGRTVAECKEICDATANCGGFNYPHGVLKQTDCASKAAHEASVSLYVKKTTPQPPAPAPKWGRIWPIPKSVDFTGAAKPGERAPVCVSPSLRITASSTSARLGRAIARYEALITAHLPACVTTTAPAVLSLLVLSLGGATTTREEEEEAEALSIRTNYSYSLVVATSTSEGGATATATASSIYGLMYAMETFAQLITPALGGGSGGTINASGVVVRDAPAYAHRGFMADTGRRFWPRSTVEALLDAMAWNKLNILHLHLSDNCRFAIRLSKFPGLTDRLTGPLGGSYSEDDVRALVAYAGDRGIRVIPEMDSPGHAQGLQGLSGASGEEGKLVFCGGSGGDGPFSDLQNDANGTTIATLKAIFTELAALFPDNEMFIGADETSPAAECTVAKDYVPIEAALVEHITSQAEGGLNRTVGGWEEYAFETGVARPAAASAAKGQSANIVNTWHYHTQAEAVARGFETVAANDSHFYLVYGGAWPKYWVDIADGFASNATRRALLRGGVVSAWGDQYCYVAYCLHIDKFPAAHALFPPSMDDAFHKSILAVSFPRAAVAAGSFWNYDGAVTGTAALGVAIDAMNARLIARGIPSCPEDCSCNAASQCGVPYANESSSAVETLTLRELMDLGGRAF